MAGIERTGKYFSTIRTKFLGSYIFRSTPLVDREQRNAEMTTSLSPSETSYIITGLTHPASPTRLDGRTLLTPRPISISYGVAPQASGSARVILDGGTEVVAGIRLEVTDVDPNSGRRGREGWRGRVEVDVCASEKG